MKSTLPYEIEARSLIQKGRHKLAHLAAQKWAIAEPDNAEAWFYKSICEMMITQYKQALVSIERITKLDSNTNKYTAQYARMLVLNGETKKGLAVAKALALVEHR